MTAKPNFLIIGAPKCGTTSLCAILRQHPDIFMPECKEPDFFSRDEVFARGQDWYGSLFAGVQSEAAISEASPSYCMVESFPRAPERIASFLPEAKIIYIVRHPLERMETAWAQFLHSGHPVSRSFTKAVREYLLFLEQSRYWQTIAAYRKQFPDDRLLVVDFEDLRSDAASAAAECFRFLGVDPDFRVADAGSPRNSRAGKRMERTSIRWMRRSPVWELLKAAIPSRFRRWSYQSFGTAPLPQQPVWDRETRAWVIDQLQ